MWLIQPKWSNRMLLAGIKDLQSEDPSPTAWIARMASNESLL